ncbi:MAG: DNA polymerase I [Verrucomicrobiota bacterium]|nr:DNA polymerase I [Verrucomicrobiota bacterium]
MGKTLFLLDGMALLYRAHFAFISNPIRTSSGMNTSAMYGFLNVILELRETHHPTHLAVALDTAAPTERHRVFPSYKAQREAMPEELAEAIPNIYRLCEALNIPVLAMDGFEADDIIGTMARKAETDGFTTYMVTPDKDFSQLVTEHTFLFRPGRKGGAPEIEGMAETCQRWQVDHPLQVIDILGLWGDASDNIPGVPGIGEKTAKKLIKQYASVEQLLDHADEIKGKMGEKLLAHRESALLSKQLATINLQVPINWNEWSLELVDPDEARLKPLIVEWEFNALGKRLFGETFKAGRGFKGKDAGTGQGELDLMIGNESVPLPAGAVSSAGAVLKTLSDVPHTYDCIQSEPELDDWVQRLMAQSAFCMDTETTGLDPKSIELLGISLCAKGGKACYIPLNREDGLSSSYVQAKLAPLLENPRIAKVGHHLKYDLNVLHWHGFRVQGPFIDTMILHSLMRPDQKHGLDYLAEAYLGYSPVSIETLIGPKGGDQGSMKDVALEKLTTYAAEDADITWQLYRLLEPDIAKLDLDRLFHELEMPLLPVLASMEQEGIRLNTHSMRLFSAQLLEQIQTLEQGIHAMAGEEFNIGSPKQLGEILFGKLKLVDKPKKTKTGQYATNENVLQSLAGEHGIIQKILEYRIVTKLRSTYAEALPQSIFEPTGRIHTTFHQTATATGRLSSQHPNLQNIPIRRELGQEIRRAFVPRGEGYALLSADYSQIELRIMASMSGDPSMAMAFKAGEDVHAATAARIYKVALTDVTREMRRRAKTVNFGIMYGISPFGLSQRLRISRAEAAEIIEEYFQSFPLIKDYMALTLERARSKGYVETLLGRRRYLPDIQSANGTIRNMAERNAINAPIQGSAADMIKLAMSAIWSQLQERELETRLVLQVHDELVFDLREDEETAVKSMVRDLMVEALPLSVPVEVDIGMGANWLEAH